MSVDPVQSSSPVIDHPAPEKRPHTVPPARSIDPENTVKVEISKPKYVPPPLAIPEHEVKIVLDTRDSNTLVYQVLDKQSGDVVLQVPPADQLRGIHESQELLQRIAARAKAAAAGVDADSRGEEGNDNGHKL